MQLEHALSHMPLAAAYNFLFRGAAVVHGEIVPTVRGQSFAEGERGGCGEEEDEEGGETDCAL